MEREDSQFEPQLLAMKLLLIWVMLATTLGLDNNSKGKGKGNGNGNGSGNSNGKGRGVVPAGEKKENAMKKFRIKHKIKEKRDLPLQAVANGFVKSKKGEEYSIESLVPVSIFTETAIVTVNGEDVEVPQPVVFKNKDKRGTIVTVFEDDNGEVKGVNINEDDGELTSLVALDSTNHPDVLVGVEKDDYDKDQLEQFRLAEGIHLEGPDLVPANFPTTRRLGSQVCTSYKVIEVAIAYDTSYCNDFGGSSYRAGNEAARIVAAASDMYQQLGLCVILQMNRLEGWCGGADPYASMNRDNSGCDGSGLLQELQQFWNSQRASVKRDGAHLFSGTGMECDSTGCVIGCASINALCTPYAYGVNWITYTADLNLRAVLFAHELGHNAGSRHRTSSPDSVMYPYINAAREGFHPDTLMQMNNYFSTQTCLATIDACIVNVPSWIGDGYCDGSMYNNEFCGWDGGDCCASSCASAVYGCGGSGYGSSVKKALYRACGTDGCLDCHSLPCRMHGGIDRDKDQGDLRGCESGYSHYQYEKFNQFPAADVYTRICKNTHYECKSSCSWNPANDRYASSYAAGDSASYTLEQAQKRCLELPDQCAAVTCSKNSGSCTVRASGLRSSPNGQITYVPTANCWS